MKKVIVGISGGIDSAVTAALLLKEGFDVFGIHIQVGEIKDEIIERLKKIEDRLGIQIQLLDSRAHFQKSVISYFKNEHLAGRSPSPCAICNPTFKWHLLQEKMKELEAVGIASGHYIQKELKNGIWFLKKGKDEKKDQSYFLWGLEQNLIKNLVTPLGDNQKQHTRELAKFFGLDFLVTTKESTGLCFSNGLGYNALIDSLIPEARSIGEGPIKDEHGNVIGKHKGYIYYTIGQKKDLSLDVPENLCVTKIIAEENTLIASKPETLWKKSFLIDRAHFMDLGHTLRCENIQVKVRGYGWNPEGNAIITRLSKDLFKIELENPAWAPAPGQPAVLYENDLVLGGGIIR